MKVIIAGGRDFDDWDYMVRELSQFDKWRGGNTEFVSGTARGADRMGERLAELWDTPVKKFPADWKRYNKAAGHRRNYEMARYADVLIAFWDSESSGTRNMIDNALREGLEVHVYRYTN